MFLKRYGVTASAAVLTIVFLTVFELSGVDTFDYLVRVLMKINQLGMDRFIVPAFMLMGGLMIDLMIANRQRAHAAADQELKLREEIRSRFAQAELHEQALQIEVRDQRLRVMRATMRTVQHLVNNFLSHIQLFRLEVEDLVDERSLNHIDIQTRQLVSELTALGDLEATPEKETCIGTLLDCDATRILG